MVKMISSDEVADFLGISRRTLYRWIKEKGIPVYKMGALDRFKLSEIEEWVEKKRCLSHGKSVL